MDLDFIRTTDDGYKRSNRDQNLTNNVHEHDGHIPVGAGEAAHVLRNRLQRGDGHELDDVPGKD